MKLVADMAQVAADLGAPGYIVELCVIQADSESRGDPLVGLGVPDRFPPGTKPNRRASERVQRAEAIAAEKGFLRRYERYGQSPDAIQGPKSPALVNYGDLTQDQKNAYNTINGVVPDLWTFGSGGLYGHLPSTGLAYTKAKGGTELIASGAALPTDVFDPWRATVMHANFLRSIIVNYLPKIPEQHRNIYALKRAAASLSLLKDVNETKTRSQNIRKKMPKRLERNGIPLSFTEMRFLASDWDNWPGAWDMIVEGEKLPYIQSVQRQITGGISPEDPFPAEDRRWMEEQAIAQASGQVTDIEAITDIAFAQVYPECPSVLNPNNPAHATCINAWMRMYEIAGGK